MPQHVSRENTEQRRDETRQLRHGPAISISARFRERQSTDNGPENPERRCVHTGLGENLGAAAVTLRWRRYLRAKRRERSLVVTVDNHPHAGLEEHVLDLVYARFERQQAFAASNGRPFHEHVDNRLARQKHGFDENDFE